MTNYKNLQTALGNMHEIKKSTTAVAKGFKDDFLEKQAKLQSDRMLSAEGRIIKIDEYKAEQGAKFLTKAKEMRTEYDQAAEDAQKYAEMILNDPAHKPNEATLATFDRQLARLQTELMLSTNADSALSLVKTFAEQTTDAYLIGKFKETLPTIISEITTLAGVQAPQYKLKLRKMVDGLAVAPEIEEAQAVIDGGSMKGSPVWLEHGVQLTTIRQVVSGEYAQFANNPTAHVAETEV
ncbi:hypothetical protein SporoP8_13930 [Sporosarcina ureae]|uniref:hypothetical protein n=1 Tax=Sporosarcina ureae TaxID=1571 RepID=UPI000A15D33B|nr:hypothetical protein [Sporosarcina ureae]ARJ39879.1 hypothetical protein SporoP8_13930 [Sporosarcina ureae]